MDMPVASRRGSLVGLVPLFVVIAALATASSATWAANKFAALRVDERVAHFNMYVGNFMIPEPVTISADYEYDGSQGYPVYVGVEVHNSGTRDTRFGYVPFKIDAGKGKGRAACRVSTVADRMPKVTQPVSTNQIVFKMYKGGGSAFFTKTFDLDCIWPKPYDDITRADIALVDGVGGSADATPAGPSIALIAQTEPAQAPKPRATAAAAAAAQPAIKPIEGLQMRLPNIPVLGTSGLTTNKFNVGMSTQWVMLVGKTNQGRYFAALAEHMSSSDLYLRKWKVFAADGSVQRSGNNTKIARTYTIDLDAGSADNTAKDLWWEFETETKRNITPRNGAKMAVVYLRYAQYNLASPPAKKIFLELDKLQGVDYPPYAVERGGRTNSMQSIYAGGGIDLQLYSDEGNIPDLKAGGSYSSADLDSLFDAHYNASGPAGYWHMHGAMVTTHPGGYLGLMYRTGDRKGFAVFTKSFGSGADRDAKLLRTTAHELGHAVNLFHSDGDANSGGAPVAGAGHTVMNQTWTLASDWGYDWSTASHNHLNSHPMNRIQPGTDYGFNECISSHEAQY